MDWSGSIKKMKDSTQEYFTRHKIPSGCAVFGVANEAGERFDGRMLIDGISVMKDLTAWAEDLPPTASILSLAITGHFIFFMMILQQESRLKMSWQRILKYC